MPVHINAGRLIDVTGVANTNVITTDPLILPPHRIGMQVDCNSTTNGSLQRQVFIGLHNPKTTPEYPESGWVNVGAPIAVVGGTQSQTVINGAHPPTRFQYTPVAQPHTTVLIANYME